MWEACWVHGLHSACLDGKIISNMLVCLNKMEHFVIKYDKHHMDMWKHTLYYLDHNGEAKKSIIICCWILQPFVALYLLAWVSSSICCHMHTSFTTIRWSSQICCLTIGQVILANICVHNICKSIHTKLIIFHAPFIWVLFLWIWLQEKWSLEMSWPFCILYFVFVWFFSNPKLFPQS